MSQKKGCIAQVIGAVVDEAVAGVQIFKDYVFA